MKKVLITIVITAAFIKTYSQFCYQDYVKNHSSTIKPIGKIGKKSIYAEVLSFVNGAGTNFNTILLRNDSLQIAEYDICFITENGFETIVSKITDTSKENIKYSLNDIKSVFQLLSMSINYAAFTNNQTKLYIKKNLLYLEYTEGSCITGCPYYKVTEKYGLVQKGFKILNKKRKRL